jgi:hypothetical protein
VQPPCLNRLRDGKRRSTDQGRVTAIAAAAAVEMDSGTRRSTTQGEVVVLVAVAAVEMDSTESPLRSL